MQDDPLGGVPGACTNTGYTNSGVHNNEAGMRETAEP